MKSFVIEKNDADQRLDKFIQKAVPQLPKSLMYKYIRKKYIKLNSKRCEPNTVLNIGDVVQMYISDEFFSAKKCREEFDILNQRNVDIIYEDENIALLYKEPEFVCHSGNKNEKDTLIDWFLAYLSQKGEYDPICEASFTPALCNRLDKNTCGIVIAAKNAASLRAMNEAIKENQIAKEYLCATVKKTPKNHDVIHAYLRKDSSCNKVFVTQNSVSGSKKIITEYTNLRQKDNLFLLRVRLHTGRTHQIRAHLAHIGAPILGDIKYGDDVANKRYNAPYQALCAHKIGFSISESSRLSYLNGMAFETDKVWFVRKYFK